MLGQLQERLLLKGCRLALTQYLQKVRRRRVARIVLTASQPDPLLLPFRSIFNRLQERILWWQLLLRLGQRRAQCIQMLPPLPRKEAVDLHVGIMQDARLTAEEVFPKDKLVSF